MSGMEKGDLPGWAHPLWEAIGSPDIDPFRSRLDGDLIERRPGLRRDDLVEIYLDARSLPEGENNIRRGRLVEISKTSLELLDEEGMQRFIARDALVEIILIAHLRPAYLDDDDLIAFEHKDMKRRKKRLEKAETDNMDDEQHIWG